MPAPWEKYQEAEKSLPPWEKYQTVAAAEPGPDVSIPESVLRGAAQGGSLGFADELAGFLGSGNRAVQKRSLQDVVKDYIASRDAYRAGDEAAKKANPKSFLGGQLGGGVATALIPGLGVAKGASALTNIGRVAGTSALNAIGSSEADNVGDLAKDTAIGTGVGLVGMGTGQLLSRAIPTAAGSARLATQKAIDHLRPTPKVARVLGPQRLNEIGREALDSGAIGFGKKAGDTAANLAGNREVLGKEIGSIVEGSEARINPVDVADRFQKEVIDPLKGQAANSDIVAKLEGQKKQFLDHYQPEKTKLTKAFQEGGDEAAQEKLGNLAQETISPGQLEGEKRAVQKSINYLTDPKAAQKAQMGYANVLKNESEKAIDNPVFQKIKERFGKTAEGQLMAERTAGLTDSGTGLIGHLYDMGAGHLTADALMHGNPAGLAVGGARALARGRTSSAIAVGADKAGKFMQANPNLNKLAEGAENITKQGGAALRQGDFYTKKPKLDATIISQKLSENPDTQKFAPAIQAAAERGDDSLAATHFILSQTQPEYQRVMQEDEL